MEKTKEQQPNTPISVSPKLLQRVIFDWMLLIGFFLSFAIFTSTEFYEAVWRRSLSGIGWRMGHHGRLFFYTFFTIGYFVYQARLFTKQSKNKQHVINWMLYIGSVLMLAGACMPIGDNRSATLDILHSRFCQLGTGLMALAVVIMAIAYCRETKTSTSSKLMVIIPAIAVIVLGALGLFSMYDPDNAIITANYTFMATFMVMVFTHYMTVCFELAEKKDTPPQSLFKYFIRRKNGEPKNPRTAGK